MPRYFNSVLLSRTAGANQRQICTTTQGNINLKTTAPRLLKPTYDQATGLAEIFKALHGAAPTTVTPPAAATAS